VTSSFSAALRCPDDGHLLQANAKGDVRYAMCRHCDGLWFTKEAIGSKKAATLPDRNLGPRVNTPSDEYHPTLSQNQRDLYFVRRGADMGNFYRISTRILEAFKQ